jgi:hypothetical protein
MRLFRYRLSATALRAVDIPGGRIASLSTRMDAWGAEATLPPFRPVGDGIVVRATPEVSRIASTRVDATSATSSPATGQKPLELPTSVLSLVCDSTQFVTVICRAAEMSRVTIGRDRAAAPRGRSGVVEVTMPPAERVRS